MSHKISNWIGGIPSPPHDGRYFENRNPATNQVIALVPQSTEADVESAVQAAQAALPSWGKTTPAERADLLEAVADCIAERLEEFAALESQDQGKPIGLARRVDIPRAIANFRFFASAIRQFPAESYAMPGALNYTSRKPIGIVVEVGTAIFVLKTIGVFTLPRALVFSVQDTIFIIVQLGAAILVAKTISIFGIIGTAIILV